MRDLSTASLVTSLRLSSPEFFRAPATHWTCAGCGVTRTLRRSPPEVREVGAIGTPDVMWHRRCYDARTVAS